MTEDPKQAEKPEDIILSVQRATTSLPHIVEGDAPASAPSVIVESAEGITTFAGFAPDSREMERIKARVRRVTTDPQPDAAGSD